MLHFSKKQHSKVEVKLLKVLNERNPFRNFKEKLHDVGLVDEWYAFQNAEASQIMQDWLELHGLSYEILNQKYKRL
jgi:hypothetical protein